MKVIIAGTRHFTDYNLLKDYCDQILANQSDIEIVSGGAKGGDALGEQYANEKGYQIKRFLPDWDKYGKTAGPIRNEEMARYADALIAFWDSKSLGTKNMIELGKRYGLRTRVKLYTEL